MLSPLNEITNTQYNCITNFPCNCTAFPVYLSLLRSIAAYSPGKLLRACLDVSLRILILGPGRGGRGVHGATQAN